MYFKNISLCSLWLLVLLFPAFAWGDDFSLTPSLSVQEAYNSNILLSATDIRKDFITTLSPVVEMVDRTGRLDTDLLLHLDRLEYAENQGLSGTNQLYNGTLKYLVSPLLSVSGGAGYSRNANPTLLGIGAAGFITTAVPWSHITYSGSAEYQFNEKTLGTLSYSNGRDYYENPNYLSDRTRNAGAGLVYDLGKYFPSVKGRMNVGYSYYAYPNTRINSAMCTVGLSKDFDEVWSFQVDGGINNTWSAVSIPVQIINFGLIMVPVNKEGLGWVGDASLNYKGELGSGSLTFSRSLSPAYGLNGAAEQDALTLATQYQFSYELSALFSTSYNTLTSLGSEFSSQSISQQYFRINPGVRYEFSKNMALDASYEYDMVDNSAGNTKADRQLFSVRFYIQQPLFKK